MHFFGQFRGELEVLALAKIHPVGEFFKKKNHVFTIKLFFLLQICSLLDCSWQIPEKKFGGSPCSFKRKREFISLSSLVWGKFVTFCTCTCQCTRANDAKIVRSRVDVKARFAKDLTVRQIFWFNLFFNLWKYVKLQHLLHVCYCLAVGPKRIWFHSLFLLNVEMDFLLDRVELYQKSTG